MTIYELALENERRHQILQALYQVYPAPLAGASLLNLLNRTSQPRLEQIQLQQSLTYLADSGQLSLDHAQDPWIARLTAAGIDGVEAADGFDLATREQQRKLRLRVLMMLAIEPHQPKSETLLLSMLADEAGLPISRDSIHRALAYLAGHGLVRLARMPMGPSAMTPQTTARINPSGSDYLLGGGAELPGVARPALRG
jgi:DNA-binding transcriptional ArsR family regulator